MSDVSRNAYCGECGCAMDESPSLDPADRPPCSECGSQSRQYRMHLADNAVSVHSHLSLRARTPGERRPFMEQKAGDSFFVARQKWMQLRQVVDRRNNRYFNQVHDPETGEVVRYEDER